VYVGKVIEVMDSLEELRKINLMISKGYVLVAVKSLNKYYSVLPLELFNEQNKAIMSGCSKMFVHRDVLSEMDKKLQEHKEREKLLNQTARLNNKGIAYEKEGKIKQAINVYEKNIELGYPAHRSFQRLMILYRKAKDYDNEMRVIERAIEIFPGDTLYISRYEKAHKLKNKQ
jgi:tetratricopeptide (TPR) repeat protein